MSGYEDFLELLKYILHYLDKIRALGRPGYRVALGEDKGRSHS